jgi:hypothetical protein
MADNQVLIQIRADVADINAKLADVKGYIGKITDESKKMGSESKASWAMFSAGIASVTYLIGTLKNQVMSAASVVLEFAQAFGEQEEAENKLKATMAAHGIATKELVGFYQELAAEFQGKTIYGDEQIMNMERMLTVAGVMPSKMRDALDATVALAASGADLDGATKAVARAMEGNYRALGQIIPAFRNASKEGLTFKDVLSKIKEYTGNVAAAEMAGYLGQVKQLKNAWGDVQEEIGKRLIPTLLEGMKFLKEFFHDMQRVAGATTLAWKKEELALQEQKLAMLKKEADMQADMSDMPLVYQASLNYTEMIAQRTEKIKSLREDIAAIEKEQEKTAASGDAGFVSPTLPKKEDEAAKLAKQWATMKETLAREMNTDSLDKFDRKVSEIVVRAAKMRAEFEKIPGAMALISAWEESMIDTERMEKYLDNERRVTEEKEKQLKLRKEAADEASFNRILVLDEEINDRRREREQLLITENDYIKAQIRYYEELLKIEEEKIDLSTQDSQAYQQSVTHIHQIVQKLKDLNVQQRAYSNNLAAGWGKGWASAIEGHDSGFKQMEYTARETATAMSDAFSDLFFDVITGKTKTFADYFRSVLQAVARAVANNLAQSTTAGIGGFLQGIMSFVGGKGDFGSGSGGEAAGVDTDSSGIIETWHTGGVVGVERAPYRIVPRSSFSHAPRYHSGIGPDERPAILKDGEGVFTPGQMAAIGQGLGGTHYNITIAAVDSKSFEDMVNRNPGAIVTVIGQALKDNIGLRYLMKDTVI